MKLLKLFLLLFVGLTFIHSIKAQPNFATDTIKTNSGDLLITFVGHGSLNFSYSGKNIYIDPVSRYADYSIFPKADIILVTHQHGDHFDQETIKLIEKPTSTIYLTQACAEKSDGKSTVLYNGDSVILGNIKIEAVPAYNLVHKRDNGSPFHPKGEGNGYVITFDNIKVYIAGDTENVPEMANLKDIDIAFLPMNLPYTMTPDMVADAVELFKPKILYPYHFGETNINDLLGLMKSRTYCEVRIRDMK